MKKVCPICESTFETGQFDGSKKFCSKECFRINKRERNKRFNASLGRRNYMIDKMRDRRRKRRIMGIPEDCGTSFENFSNLAVTPEGRVVAALQLNKAILKLKKNAN